MTRTNRPKAQHYVPQFYLRNFATQRKNDFYLNCFNKTNGQSFQSNVRNIAHQNYFYNFRISNGEETSLESLLHDLESEAQPAISEIIENPSIKCLQTHIEILSYFIYVQEIRTPDFRETHDDLVSAANTQICQKCSTQESVFINPTENDTKMFQALYLVDSAEDMAEVLRNMKWVLVINQTKMPFWTSDNPVFRYNSNKEEFRSTLGFLSKGIEIYFPLSPNIVVLICDPVEHVGIPSVIGVSHKRVEFLNGWQVINSRKYLYSKGNSFDLAKELIQKNPMLANPKRPRIKVS